MSDSKPDKRGRFWPWAVGALLLLILTINVGVFLSATGDGGAVIVEDYYQKAIDWDAGQAELAASRALGWTAALSFREVPAGLASAAGADPPNTLVFVALRDSLGAPVEGAAVMLAGGHRGHERLWRAAASPMDGGYGAAFRLGPAGLWDWRVDATLDGKHFIQSETRELGSAP